MSFATSNCGAGMHRASGSLAGMAESARRNEFRGLFLSIPKHPESRVDVLLPCPRIRGTVKQELSDSATMPTVN